MGRIKEVEPKVFKILIETFLQVPAEGDEEAPRKPKATVGFDVNIVGQAVHVTGATVAGHQPSTDAPDGSAIDTSTSDVRIQALVSATPTAGIAPNITLGSVTATRDVQIDSYGG